MPAPPVPKISVVIAGRVRSPITGDVLALGEHDVPNDTFWNRRLNDGARDGAVLRAGKKEFKKPKSAARKPREED
jgi:hypothetical protein